MSKISNLIFNGKKHYITSKFGKRAAISTSAGTTGTMHNGTDYGTDGLKIPQYAIEDGYIFAAAKATDGAYYVWVIYPRVKLAFLHYHLDSYAVKNGQKVKKGTILGYTGKTGRATGIHLHLGVRDLKALTTSQINAMTWDNLRKCAYVDPEKVAYTEYVAPAPINTDITIGGKATIQRGAVWGGLTTVKGKAVPAQYVGNSYTVSQIATHNGRVEALLKELVSWVPVEHLAAGAATTTKLITKMASAKNHTDGYGNGKKFTLKAAGTLRYGPGSNYGVISSLAKGTKVTWYGYYTGNYYYVAVGKQTGFVDKSNLN